MYTGGLGQVGERFMLYAEKGRSVSCPAGTTQESSGKMGTGQKYVQCYRPPVFAPPPVSTVTYEAPRTTVSVPTAITTAVSPQISPVMAQQQASPGATVAASPVSAPGPTTGAATVPTGISASELRDILAADAEADRRAREVELETFRREIAERSRVSDELYLASQQAIESQEAIPPPPSTAYMPTGGGALPAMPPAPMLPPPDMTMAPQARDVTITQDGDAETPWALILLAAAGIGAVVLVGGKGGKRKRGKT